ncbi:MAG: MFS transporter [Oscillospiraceae bacterium]|jgi:Na+/melibiose symporter-like transporter|nr:MFS transporter [Oscillospiraceae bacterium]
MPKQYAGVVPKKERISYYLGGLGQGMMYAIMSSYISDFYMNVMGLGSIFVFFLMLLARVWDAVNDPLMGIVMDRANPKRGKMRSYLFVMPLPIAVFTILLFYAPPIPGSWKMLYAAVTYTCWGMLYTTADIPFWSLSNAMAPGAWERGKIVTISRTVNGVGSAVPMALVMFLGPVLARFSSDLRLIDQLKFIITAALCAGVGGLLYFITPFRVKERVPLPPQKSEGGKGALRAVFGCKPLMLTAAMGILSGGRYMFQAGAAHVARYVFYLGDWAALRSMPPAEQAKAIQSSMSTVQMVFQAVIAAGMFITMALVPKLIDKFNYKQLIVGSCGLGGVAAVVMYFIGYEHFWALLPCLLLCSIPLGIINVVSYAMVGDSLDAMEYESGFRQNGLGQACQSFVVKLANALATSSIVLTYQIVHLDMGAINEKGATLLSVPAAQLSSVRGGMFALVSIVPAISLLLCIVPTLFYDLTGEKRKVITEGLAQRRAEEGAV